MNMRLDSRRRRGRLQPDDFDDVQYSVEVVRLGASSDRATVVDAAYDRMELVESAFVVLVGLAVITGAVVAGVVALETTTVMAREVLWYVLPMVLLPLIWLVVLHTWESLVLTPKHTATTATPAAPPANLTSSIPSRRASKVAIY